MRIRVAGFNHPESDRALVYRKVESLDSLFRLIKKAVEDKGANLFSIRIWKEKK